jgi:hypothetical protein
VLHDIGTAQVPLPAKNVRLSALPTLSAQLSALFDPMFADVSVPLVGTGALGDGAAVGWVTRCEVLVETCLLTLSCLDGPAAKLSIANEKRQSSSVTTFRMLMKADLEEDFLFMSEFIF